MTIDAWIVLVVIIATMVMMALDRLPTAAALGIGITAMLVTGAIDDDTALAGLASPATATIAALYVVAGAVSLTGALSWLLDRLMFGQRRPLVRLTASTAAMSSVVPNTPLVALGAPRIVRWSRISGTPASRFLMPLSFASILGGVVTLLGTSTNLVVSDVLRSSGDEALGVFEVTAVGAPVAVVGLVVLWLAAPRLLRERVTPAASGTVRQFEAHMVVKGGGALDGATVEGGGLRDLDGLFLAAIERDGHVQTAAAGSMLSGGDYLYFVGDVDRLVDLHQIDGMVSAEERHLLDTEGPEVRLYEAVVAARSDLAGRTLRDAGFRARYQAAVLAVQRADEGIGGKLGAAPLFPGDVLVILAGPEFGRRWRDHGDFSLVSSLDDPPPPRRDRAWVAAVALGGLVVLSATGLMSLFAASVVAAGLVVAGGALGVSEARRSVDLNVVLTIAASISVGSAVESSGLASTIGDGLVDVASPLGAVGLLAAVIVGTQLLTELLSNSGAAAIMVPIAMSAAVGIGADPRVYALGVLIGASCSFLTPVGYQTNLMVYSLGGYRFGDYTRLGLPLTISSALVATAALSLWY